MPSFSFECGITQASSFALEALRSRVPATATRFDHAVFLTVALGCGDELRRVRGQECAAINVADLLTLHAPACSGCGAALPQAAVRSCQR